MAAGMLVVAGALAAYTLLPLRGGHALPTTAAPATSSDVVYASGERLHIAAEEYEISPAPDALALTAGGLYFLSDGVLHLWGREGSTRVAEVGEQWLETTADGRYLGLVDREGGPLNLVRQRVAQTVVFDTTTGEEVLRDVAGNGDRWEAEDLSLLYSESPPDLLGFDDQHVYAATASGDTYRWDLTTGERTNVGDTRSPETPNRPGGAIFDFDLVDGLPVRGEPEMGGSLMGRLSPDGATVAYMPAGIPTVFRHRTDGTTTRPVELPFDATQLVLVGWLDDDQFLGMGVTGSEGGGEVRNDRVQMTTCSVATMSCRGVGEPVVASEASLPVTPFGDPRY